MTTVNSNTDQGRKLHTNKIIVPRSELGIAPRIIGKSRHKISTLDSVSLLILLFSHLLTVDR